MVFPAFATEITPHPPTRSLALKEAKPFDQQVFVLKDRVVKMGSAANDQLKRLGEKFPGIQDHALEQIQRLADEYNIQTDSVLAASGFDRGQNNAVGDDVLTASDNPSSDGKQTEPLPDHVDTTKEPYSNDPTVREKWLNNLLIHRLSFNPMTDKIIETIGKGDNGRVYIIDRNGLKTAVKFYKKNAEPRSRKEYAGLLLMNELFPKNFPKPHGALADRHGRILGLEMDVVDGRPLIEFFDLERMEKGGKPRFKEGLSLDPNIFDELIIIIKKLHTCNLTFRDWNGGKILIDNNGTAHMIDVSYITDATDDNNKETDLTAILDFRTSTVEASKLV